MKFKVGDKVVFDVTIIPTLELDSGTIQNAMTYPYLTIVSVDSQRKNYKCKEIRGNWGGVYWKLWKEPNTFTDEELFTI